MDEGSGPIIAYGTHQFILKVAAQPWYPGSYPNTNAEIDALSPQHYMPHFPSEHLLNNDYVFVPIGEVIKNSSFFFNLFQTNQLFIKDNAVFKKIPAKVLTADNIKGYLELYKDTHFIEDYELVLVSSPKEIYSEHRFVIVEGKVVAQSTYMWKGSQYIIREVSEAALALAEKLAKTYKKTKVTPEEVTMPAGCYTMDIAMQGTNDKDVVPKLLELNSFSCAGLYACDLDAVVDAVTKKALLDYKQGPASNYN
jgi:hypothetical protein